MIHLRITPLLICTALLALPALGATGKDKDKEAKPESPLAQQIEKVKSSNFKKELKALDEAANILDGVTDEKSAKAACTKIYSLFKNLPPLLGGNAFELDLLAKAQNRVSLYMWQFKKEPFFESVKMQETWTLMTDQFSRPCVIGK